MSKEKLRPRRLLRWGASLVGVVVLVICFQVGLLAFPQLLLTNEAVTGSLVVHYRGETDP